MCVRGGGLRADAIAWRLPPCQTAPPGLWPSSASATTATLSLSRLSPFFADEALFVPSASSVGVRRRRGLGGEGERARAVDGGMENRGLGDDTDNSSTPGVWSRPHEHIQLSCDQAHDRGRSLHAEPTHEDSFPQRGLQVGHERNPTHHSHHLVPRTWPTPAASSRQISPSLMKRARQRRP